MNKSINHEKKVVKGSSQEIAKIMAENDKELLEAGAHNLLIYNDLKSFREIYSYYSRALLPENEIIIIATQYAQQGYQDADGSGIWKLSKSLISRAKKEDRRGVTIIGDLDSFFSFEKIEELIQYELSLPQKYEDTLKGFCCYHLKDFEKLTETQQQTLFDHHFKSILIE